MATATSSRRPRPGRGFPRPGAAGAGPEPGKHSRATTPPTARRRRQALTGIAAATVAAISAATITLAALPGPGGAPAGVFPQLVPAAAPAGWRHLTLPNGAAVLSYPPSLHPVASDSGAVSAARLTPGGAYRLYLNATPGQGSENLRTWAALRLAHLRADDAASAHQVAAARGVRFRGGTGSCLIDSYSTRIGHHHYQEIACLVQGRTSASVIVAAAPATRWAQARPLLFRAVTAYQAR